MLAVGDSLRLANEDCELEDYLSDKSELSPRSINNSSMEFCPHGICTKSEVNKSMVSVKVENAFAYKHMVSMEENSVADKATFIKRESSSSAISVMARSTSGVHVRSPVGDNIHSNKKGIFNSSKTSNFVNSPVRANSFVSTTNNFNAVTLTKRESIEKSESLSMRQNMSQMRVVTHGNKQCMQCTSLKNKENEEPKATKTSSQYPALRSPAKLMIDNKETSVGPEKKQIVTPKKNNSVISPNKLDSTPKTTPVNSVSRPQTVPNNRTPLAPLNSNKKNSDTPKKTHNLKPQSASVLQTPTSVKKPATSPTSEKKSATSQVKKRPPLVSTTMDLSHVKSPVAEYIKIPVPPLIRNGTPSRSNAIRIVKPQVPVTPKTPNVVDVTLRHKFSSK